MLCPLMRPPGAYKIANQARGVPARAVASAVAPAGVDPRLIGSPGFGAAVPRNELRVQRILESLRSEIVDGGAGLRIRRVFETPREIFRLELELPELGYQRTILLDRDTLEELLEADGVRAVVASAGLAP